MEIVRHCSERLPGGLRRWRRLARLAEYRGRLEVYGYGVHGGPGRAQRRASRTGQVGGIPIADFTFPNGPIRVWVNAPCRAVVADDVEDPLMAFAHELGHYRQAVRGRLEVPKSTKAAAQLEAVAERYGRMLFRRASER